MDAHFFVETAKTVAEFPSSFFSDKTVEDLPLYIKASPQKLVALSLSELILLQRIRYEDPVSRRRYFFSASH